MSPSEIVTLACAIRSSAEKGISCLIKLPSDANSSVMWTLHSYRFAQALGATSRSEAWQKEIQFENFTPSRIGTGKLTVTKRRILPLSWIDIKTFGYIEPPPNLYREDPEFNPEYQRFVSGILHRNGFIAEDAIDDFVRGVLREIGWNAVLHSNKGEPGGFAAFAGEVSENGSKLEFSLADAGCGIASNLLASYRVDRNRGVVPAYEKQYQCSETAAVVRYAFEPKSTSRNEFPTEYDVFSDRGLSLVAEIVREHGSINLLSSSVAVSMPPIGNGEIFIRDMPTKLPWTCLYGSLMAHPQKDTKLKSEAVSDFENQIANADFYSAAPILGSSTKHPLVLAERVLRRMRTTSKNAVVDLGFLDKSAREVENGFAVFAKAITPNCVTFINVQSLRISPKRIARAMKKIGFVLPVTIRLLSGQQQFKEVSLSQAEIDLVDSGSTGENNFEWKTITVTESAMCAIHFRATSVFMRTSFRRGGSKYGFYQGRIHLLSGNVIERYFSLVAHLQSDIGANAHRWNDAFGRLLEVAMENSEISRTKVLGFAASMRLILNSLDKAHPIRDETYCLLSYDAPSKAELAEIVQAEDEVILCTDVISSASLLREVVTLIRRIGANVRSVIALVDARETPADTWKAVFEPELVGIPLLLASSMRRGICKANLPEKFDYWVDPVSAVPMMSEPESVINLDKVLQTVNLLSSTDSVTIGHFVSGLRHTSVRIDMFKLLSADQKISELSEAEIQNLLKKEEWADFRPEVVLVPAGISRIDKLSTSNDYAGSRPSSEVYADIVSTLFQRPLKIIPVSRTFEPGGQAKCAAITYIGESYKLTDVVIVDDGISSGGTIRSLMHQAVRAGAERILVFALLARTAPEELDQWSLTREVFDRSLSGHALVSLIYPLHLPIPFTGKADCPQCATLISLEKRGSNKTFMQEGWRAIESDLAAPYAYKPSKKICDYVQTWLFVHALAEVASRSAEGFERLKSFLQEAMADSNSMQIRREVAVRLFLVEWRLLGRARLRQVIRRTVRELALRQLNDEETDEFRFVEALSLVRAMYPGDYIRIIKNKSAKIINSEVILVRVLFHFGTLNFTGLDLEKEGAFKALSDSLAICTDKEKMMRQQNRLENMIADFTRSSRSTDIAFKIRALDVAMSGSVVVHDVIGTLSEITKIEPKRLDELKNLEYFVPLAKQIEEIVIPTLKREVYPLLEGLEELIGVQLEHLKLLETTQKSYFVSNDNGELPCLFRDIETIGSAFNNINNGVQLHSSLRVALNAANRALNEALLPGATLARVLESLTCMTVSSVMVALKNSFEGFLPDSEIDTQEVTHEDSSGQSGTDVRVLCPQTFITQFATLVKGNIKKHVLDAGVQESQLRLLLSFGFLSLGQRRYVVFRVSNSGTTVESAAVPKFRSRIFNNKSLALVDGCFVPAEMGGDNYGSAASLRLRVFGDGVL